jgi:2-hydroxychromene-2-carboxylate isomerase
MTLRFFYDVVCPYAALAAFRIEAEAAAVGVDVAWCPVLLGGILRDIGAPARPQETWAAARQVVVGQDLRREGLRHGLPIRRHPQHPRRTVEAMRAIVAAPEGVRPALSKALFRAGQFEGRDLADREVWGSIAAAHGVDPGRVDDGAVKEELRERTAEAVRLGAFGVPTFTWGDRLWWGQDRLHRALAAASGRRIEPACRPLGGRGRSLRFLYDFSSPFAYLASTQVERVAAAHGAALEPCPMLLGALFRDIGTPDIPLFEMTPPRQRWILSDFDDQAAYWGVPFRFPSRFPLRTVTPLRVALVEPAVRATLFEAAWAHDRDIGDDDVLRGVLDEAGFAGADLIAATRDPAVKARLIANGAEARAAGACGVPSFVVDGRTLIWGQDRLAVVEEVLSGWEPGDGVA